MKIGLVQLNSIDNIEYNLNRIFEVLDQYILNSVSSNRANLFILPENSLYFRLFENAQIEAVSLQSDYILQLKNYCRLQKINIHLTNAIEDNGQIFNASVLIRENGTAQLVYKKIHLFDIHLEGQKPIRESDVFRRGDEVTQFDVDGLKFGSSICYDLRFSDLYLKHAMQGADILLVPAAILVKTGQAHWEVLLRARAIESQCYVLAPGQAGEHQSITDKSLKRYTYGHSMIIDPWGRIIASMNGDQVGVIDVQISPEEIQKCRRQIPMSAHRQQLIKYNKLT